MRLRLPKLYENNPKGTKLKKNISEDLKNVKDIFHYEGLAYIPEIIYSKIISHHNNNLLASYFRVKKFRELVTKKYF